MILSDTVWTGGDTASGNVTVEIDTKFIGTVTVTSDLYGTITGPITFPLSMLRKMMACLPPEEVPPK